MAFIRQHICGYHFIFIGLFFTEDYRKNLLLKPGQLLVHGLKTPEEDSTLLLLLDAQVDTEMSHCSVLLQADIDRLNEEKFRPNQNREVTS